MIVRAVIDRQHKNLVKKGILESTDMGECACGLDIQFSLLGRKFV